MGKGMQAEWPVRKKRDAAGIALLVLHRLLVKALVADARVFSQRAATRSKAE
jgi:hypothetical protein